jgi:hypothetical protein
VWVRCLSHASSVCYKPSCLADLFVLLLILLPPLLLLLMLLIPLLKLLLLLLQLLLQLLLPVLLTRLRRCWCQAYIGTGKPCLLGSCAANSSSSNSNKSSL